MTEEADRERSLNLAIEMTALSGETTRLKLAKADEVEALVRVKTSGEVRPKCLLLHGNPGSLLDWEHIVPLLAGAADVAAIDLPGFGKSPRTDMTPGFLSLDRLADHTIAAADALGWREPIFLIGHSHGGGVAQTAAVRYPERVAGLALIATLGSPAHASYRLLSLPGAAAFARLVGRMFRAKSFRPISRAILRAVMSDIFSPERVPAEKLERELALFSAYPGILVSMVHVTLNRPSAQLFASAPAIRCPSLFLHGSEDALVPPNCARVIHDRIVSAGGRSQLQLVPGAGHMLIEYQAAEVANAILRNLLLALTLLLCACGRGGDERAPAAPLSPRESSSPAASSAGSVARDAPLGRADRGPAFTTGVVQREASPQDIALLTDVRYARHEGFDRIVFEFAGGSLPGYHLEYIDKPVRQCGSGEATPIAGDAWLEVRFSPANAHTPSGSATIAFRQKKLELQVLMELGQVCDFEAHVTWVLGAARPNAYRVLALEAPTRLVVDVKR